MADRRSTVVFLGSDAQLSATLTRIEGRLKGLTATADAENAKMAASSEAAGNRLGKAFDEGTNKAAGGLHRLSAIGASWGIPFSQSLETVGKRLDEATTKTGKLHEALAATGKVAAVGGLAGFAGAAYEGVKAAEKFQVSQTQMAAAAGISEKAAKSLGNTFLGTAGHSVFSGQQMVAAYAQVAGQLRLTEGHALSNAEAMKVMSAAGDLADATQTSLAGSTAALASVMQAYHMGAGQAADASNQLFNIAKSLDVPVSSVATAVDRLHGRLGVLAPSLKDVGALMLEMAGHGITGTRGIMTVNTALQTLVGGSKNVTNLLQTLGVHLFDSQGHFVGLGSAIAQLQPKFAQMTQHQQILSAQMLFGKSAGQAMLQVIQDGTSKYVQATAAVQKHNAVQQAAQAQSKTLHGELEMLKATVLDLAVKFGNFLVPKLQAVGQAVASVIGWFEKHKAAAIALASVITGVLGVAIGTYIVNKITGFIGSIQSAWGSLEKFAGKVSDAAATVVEKFTAMSSASEATAGKVEASDTAMEASNTTAGTSFTTMAGEADAGGTAVVTAASTTAAGVETADTAIEGANAAAGASFAALGGAAAAAAAVVLPFIAAYEAFNSGPGLSNTTSRDAAAANNFGMPGFNPDGTLMGGAFSHGQFSYKGSTLGGFPTSGATSGSGLAGLPSGGATSGSGIPGLPLGGGGSGRGSKSGKGAANATVSFTRDSFAIASLTALGIVPSPANVRDFTAWENQEGGNWNNAAKFNPLNTTMQAPGATSINSVGVKAYTSWSQGLKETVDTLKLSSYGGILGALKGNVSQGAFSSAVAGSPWGTGAVSAAGDTLSQAQINSLQNQVGAGGGSAPKVTYGPSQNVLNMLTMAEQLSGTPYTKAGHAAAFNETVAQIKKFGTDCSGLVSVLLKEGISGIKAAQTTQGLPTAAGLAPGAGKYVTVWDRHTGAVDNEHTFIEILGKYFEEGGVLQNHAAEMTKAQVAQEFAGGGFEAFHPTSAMLNTAVAGGTTGAAAGPTAAQSAAALQQAIANFIASLNKAANALIGTYQTLEQSGTVKTLTKALGLQTSGIDASSYWLSPALQKRGANMLTTTGQAYDRAGTPGDGLHFGYLGMAPHPTYAQALTTAIHGVNPSSVENALQAGTSPTALDKALIPILNRATAGSQAGKTYESTVVALIAAGQKGEAAALVAAHKAAMATLAQELYAQQVTKDAESLQLQATQEKDRTTLEQNLANSLLNIAKAQSQAVYDAAMAQVQQAKDTNQKIVDAMDAAATQIKDSAQLMSDELQAMATQVEDAVQAMADTSDAIVQGVQDQTAIKVDILGEKGLYGLNLIAQQQQVQYDILKAGFDQQIALAKENVDATKAQWDATIASATANVDQVQLQQDQLTAQAQQVADTVQISSDVQDAAAQANDDAKQIWAAQMVSIAQSKLDTVTMAQDVTVAIAQSAVDLSATAPKAQQDAAAATLKNATASANKAEAVASAGLAFVQGVTTAVVTQADSAYQQTQAQAAQAEAQAQGALAVVQAQAAQAEAQAQAALATAQGEASVAEAQANQGLQTVEDAAAQAEANQQALIDITKARASTEFAGSGLVVNMYNIPLENAAAVGDAMDWFARTSLQTT